jgi:hypothetical protein
MIKSHDCGKDSESLLSASSYSSLFTKVARTAKNNQAALKIFVMFMFLSKIKDTKRRKGNEGVSDGE